MATLQFKRLLAVNILMAFLIAISTAQKSQAFESAARNYLSVVGSSTVYPFVSAIAEKFGRDKKFKTPTIESTGTGGGFKLFCGGVGFAFADFADASRKIEASEIENCKKNGVKKIGEIKIGYDGIVLAISNSTQKFNLTKQQIFLALAEKVPQNGKLINNPYHKWNDINPSLPAKAIRVYGPPSTSGTRDAFVELAMERACIGLAEFIAAYPNKDVRKKQCHLMRSDGKFIEAGENDNLIVQKLKNDKDAIGIFGFSFLGENKNSIQGLNIDLIEPNFANILSGKYAMSRPLFVYYKADHLDLAPGMRQFIREIVAKDALGNSGYLAKKGLIPLSDSELKKIKDETLKNL